MSELPKAADSYFGASLTAYRQPSRSEEILRSRLLPEPTRINHEGVTPIAETARTAQDMPGPLNLAQASTQLSGADFAPPLDDGVAILAQSYFAQGQDFVGSLDDWWFSGQPI